MSDYLTYHPPYREVKDSGVREQFASGAVRDTQDGKQRPDRVLYWLPLEALERVAKHYENGSHKYERDNWRKGIPASRCLASAFRHLFQWMMGDRGEDHLSAVVFNVFCIITWEQLGRADLLDAPLSASPKDVEYTWVPKTRAGAPTPVVECTLNRRGFHPTRRKPGHGAFSIGRRHAWGRRRWDKEYHKYGPK